jgi:hypothetical protein
MRILTIRQPYAWAVAVAAKPIENRSWDTAWRGLMAIHAGQRFERHALAAEPMARAIQGWAGAGTVRGVPPWEQGGQVIAVASLVDVCRAALTGGECHCGPWALPDLLHWRLEDVVQIRPVPAKGKLGLWVPPPDLAAEVRRRRTYAMTALRRRQPISKSR